MNSPNSFHISTEGFAPAERLEAFREIYGRSMLRMDITPLSGDAPFDMDLRVHALPTALVADASRCASAHFRRAIDLIEHDDFILTVVRSGRATLSQRNREVAIADGEATFASSDVAGCYIGHTETSVFKIRFNREKMTAQLADPEAAMTRAIPRDNPALRLLKRYAIVLSDHAMSADAQLRLTIDDHLYDLAALALGATPEAREQAKGGVRAARLHAIKDDIVANIGRPDLSLDVLAKRHGVSTRYIRSLFDGTGTTFTDFVLGKRLARAHMLLADPRFSGFTISAIALEAGFGDISYFNQSFRRLYRRTPSDVRAQGRSSDIKRRV